SRTTAKSRDPNRQPGTHTMDKQERALPPALSLLSSERPRNVSWWQAAGLLFGDWGTSRLYVLGLAFLVAGTSSVWLIAAMSLLILGVGWPTPTSAESIPMAEASTPPPNPARKSSPSSAPSCSSPTTPSPPR